MTGRPPAGPAAAPPAETGGPVEQMGRVRRGGWRDAVLAAVGERGGWREQARCAETDPEAFFPGKGGSVSAAKRVCAGCPVRAECLAEALQADERHGVWGGTSPTERARLRRPHRATGTGQRAGRGRWAA